MPLANVCTFGAHQGGQRRFGVVTTGLRRAGRLRSRRAWIGGLVVPAIGVSVATPGAVSPSPNS